MDVEATYYQYWSKSKANPRGPLPDYNLLPYHCLDVAAVGRAFLLSDPKVLGKLSVFGLRKPEENINIITLFLALHDSGKFSHHFQSTSPDLFRYLQPKGAAIQLPQEYHPAIGYTIYQSFLWDVIWDTNLLGLDPTEDRYSWHDGFRYWASAVTGHHGDPPQSTDPTRNLEKYYNRADQQAVTEFVHHCGLLFGLADQKHTIPFSAATIEDLKKTSWLLAGLTVLSDWIGSNVPHFAYKRDRIPLREYWKQATELAERAISDAGVAPSRVATVTGMESLFGIPTPSHLQQYAETVPIADGPQIYIMEEATGSGKTEAAVILAHRLMQETHADGLFFALPTMATATSIYHRLRTTYTRLYAPGERPTLILAHGGRAHVKEFRNSLGFENQESDTQTEPGLETASSYCTSWLGDNRKKALLGSIGVGTIDQALMAILPRRYQSLRLLGLARNVLIVDEVHAYDSYMNGLLEILLHYHAALGGSAILLSATLPQETRHRFIQSFNRGIRNEAATGGSILPPYPLVTSLTPEGKILETPLSSREDCQRTVSVKQIHTPAEVDAIIDQVIERGECLCIIKNTVRDAISVYHHVISTVGIPNTTLFHARFAMVDRRRIEKKVTSTFSKEGTAAKRSRQIVIATQVVEQSLDIDFDHMITDLAPIDLIIQRAGRLQRHGTHWSGREPPVLHVLAPALGASLDRFWYSRMFPNGAFVYRKPGLLWRTAFVLDREGALAIPSRARHLIECVYHSETPVQMPAVLTDIDAEIDVEESDRHDMALFGGLSITDGYTRSDEFDRWGSQERVPTRLGEETVTLRLARWNDGVLVPWSSEGGSDAWGLSDVSVRAHLVDAPADDELGAIERAKQSMPDRGRWCIVIPLVESGNDQWVGRGTIRQDRDVIIRYSPFTVGLQIQQ